MITDETYFEEERQIREIFAQAGWEKEAGAEPDEERIEKIVERATVENIMKDSASFLFLSFTAVIANFLSAFFGSVRADEDSDYKP